jgi:hypothetical protein
MLLVELVAHWLVTCFQRKLNNGGNMSLKRFSYLGLLVVALIVSACGPQATPEPTATPKPTATPVPPTATAAPTATTAAPTVSEAEVPVGFTEDGAPYRGNPDASVTLLEYSDYQ